MPARSDRRLIGIDRLQTDFAAAVKESVRPSRMPELGAVGAPVGCRGRAPQPLESGVPYVRLLVLERRLEDTDGPEAARAGEGVQSRDANSRIRVVDHRRNETEIGDSLRERQLRNGRQARAQLGLAVQRFVSQKMSPQGERIHVEAARLKKGGGDLALAGPPPMITRQRFARKRFPGDRSFRRRLRVPVANHRGQEANGSSALSNVSMLGRRVGTTEKREPFGPSKGNHPSGPGLPDIHAKRLPPEALSCRVAHARRSGTSGAPACCEAFHRKAPTTKTAKIPDRPWMPEGLGPTSGASSACRGEDLLSMFDGLAVAPPCSETAASPRFSRLRRIERRRRWQETRGARCRSLLPRVGGLEKMTDEAPLRNDDRIPPRFARKRLAPSWLSLRIL